MKTRAGLAVALAMGACVLAGCAQPSTGYRVRTARLRHVCGDGRDTVVEVLPGGILRVEAEKIQAGDLERRLHEIFRTRAYRFIYLVGDPGVPFGEVAAVIDRALREVDYVTLLTPAVMAQKGEWRPVDCLDPNLPKEYFAQPRR